MPLTLEQLNAASAADALAMLDGLYEHSPWIAEQALARRPFASLAQLKRALVQVLAEAGRERQLALIRVHPELAGKAMVSKSLTSESTNEQSVSGLTNCSPAEFARIQELNAAYNAKFGWPFILAVRGPRGTGLTRAEIIETFARRLEGHPDFELAECLRNIHRVVELRLNDKFGVEPVLGNQAWDCAELLAQHSDPGFAEKGQLTVTYLTQAHLNCQAQLQRWMADCGFDEVSVDAVGNVVGVYHGEDRDAPRLLTGSHFDTVRNGGKYDGRLGIFVPMVCVRELHRARRRLPFGVEVVGFAEEEGQRYKATFLGSGALTGHFDPAWLQQRDADGIAMIDAMRAAGRPGTLAAIQALRRDPARYLGFVEVHIEQGPVLNELDLPLGVVTSINGGVRFQCEVIGMASHAGTTPMDRRRDAAVAVAELALFIEQRASREPNLVGTIGHAAGAGRLDQRRARSLPVQPRPARDDEPGARCARERRAGRTRRDLRPPRPAPQGRGDDACLRRAERSRLAAALGERGGVARPAGLPHAQRRRPRRDEAARGDAAGDAVRARPQCRHQPQPARVVDQRRHRSLRACVPAPARATRRGTFRMKRYHLLHTSPTPGRPKAGDIPSGDRPRCTAAEGQS